MNYKPQKLTTTRCSNLSPELWSTLFPEASYPNLPPPAVVTHLQNSDPPFFPEASYPNLPPPPGVTHLQDSNPLFPQRSLTLTHVTDIESLNGWLTNYFLQSLSERAGGQLAEVSKPFSRIIYAIVLRSLSCVTTMHSNITHYWMVKALILSPIKGR